jgi:hypothetical protein
VSKNPPRQGEAKKLIISFPSHGARNRIPRNSNSTGIAKQPHLFCSRLRFSNIAPDGFFNPPEQVDFVTVLTAHTGIFTIPHVIPRGWARYSGHSDAISVSFA